MKVNLILKIVIAIVLVFVLAVWLLFKFQRSYFGDYLDTDFEMSYNGEVADIKKNRGYLYVELNNGDKYNIKWASNSCYSPKRLWGFLEIGDLLNKPQNTDSIFIYRENAEYFFILGYDIECN